jgi:hypothetical protein
MQIKWADGHLQQQIAPGDTDFLVTGGLGSGAGEHGRPRHRHPYRGHAKADAKGHGPSAADDPLWLALCAAPEEGTDIGELMRITGWKRTKLYRHLREHAAAGRAIRVSGGRWRARTPEERSP